jgi:DNA repair exonuclease SbcCD ATPase subunit
MKEKYEERIEELETENEELETEKETAGERIQALQRELASRPTASSEGSSNTAAGDITTEVGYRVILSYCGDRHVNFLS